MVGRLALLLLGSIGVVAGCSPRPPSAGPTPAPDAEPAATAAEPPVVTLERTPCFGSCPVYQVSISRSGTVRFVGKQHVTREGEATAEIPAARVDSLLRELEAGGYFGFADAYVMSSPACGQYATDSPTVITSVSAGGRTKTIRHDFGCDGAPEELGRLERRIDEVASTAGWIGH
jgi:Domain of unknown function (DUF6438)